jgi:hypothetical protein
MTRFESSFRSLMWFAALLLAGCGGGSGSESKGLTGTGIGPAPISLGTASTFAILSKTGVGFQPQGARTGGFRQVHGATLSPGTWGHPTRWGDSDFSGSWGQSLFRLMGPPVSLAA